jgi:glycosyltransferase involved in cell wall biosynthesis
MQQQRTLRALDAPSTTLSVVVVIPAFGVAEHVAKVIGEVPGWVTHIVVVDDASKDGSGDLAASVGDSRVEVVRHPQNLGVGGAVLTGYHRAVELGADIIVKLDGDGQMDPTYLTALIAPIAAGEADYTKGNRFLHFSALGKMPMRRRIGNLGLSFMTKAASGYWDVFDPTNGYTAIKADVFEMLEDGSIDRRWYFETSMLIALSRIRAVVRDVAIPARYAGEKSSLSEASALRRFPPRLLGAFFRRIWTSYFVSDFSPVALFAIVGLPLFLFGLIWGTAQWIRSASVGVEASTGTIMIAVLPLILGTQLLIQGFVIDIQSPPRSPVGRPLRDA